MAEELPVGFRFYPTEVELISFYLKTQLGGGNTTIHCLIPILDVFSVEPTQLPNLAGQRCRGDAEQWLFFVPRQEREARGGRPSRTSGSGYWKATGSPGPVFSPDNRVIGVKKTMVFYTGKAPTGRKTKWKMNEYKAVDEKACASTIPKLRNEFSICRIYIKSGSSRAFDRRPMEAYGIERKLSSNGVEKLSCTAEAYGIERKLSSSRVETSSHAAEAYGIERKLSSNRIETSSRAVEAYGIERKLSSNRVDETSSHVAEAYGIERKLSSNRVETSSYVTISTSQENSYSGGDQVDLPVNDTQSNSEMVDGLSQPFWEWEQMNWS